VNEDNNQLAEIVHYFTEKVAEETGNQSNEIDIEDSFHELGLDSINAVFVLEKIELKYSIPLSPLLFWDYPTIKSFSIYINTLLKNG